MSEAVPAADQSGTDVTRRFGPVHLLSGVTPAHVTVFLFADFITIGFVAFVNISQAYLMNAKLGIPEAQQGTISGDLGLWSEVTVIAMVWLFGMLADHSGRRVVMAGGLAILGSSYIFYPFSESATHLLLARLIYAVGVAATTAMLTVIVHDYPQERSRGKLVVASGICGGLGAATIGAAGGSLPPIFVGLGSSEIDAGYYMNWGAAAVCILTALIVAAWSYPGVPGVSTARSSLRQTAVAGLRAAREPRVSIAYLSAFAARGDMVIGGTFLVLWGTLAGQAQGLETAAAVREGTLLFVIFTSMSLVWAPVMGWALDRFDRVSVLAAGAALATIGFAAVGFIDDPLDPSVKPVFVLMGIGQASCFFASQALIGQVAPLADRGAVIGAFSASGAVGVLIATGVGGRLFDALGPGSPFLMVAFATGALAFGAAAIRVREARTH